MKSFTTLSLRSYRTHIFTHHLKNYFENKKPNGKLLAFIRVWAVRYNVFHDQLVLTAGSDARVVLVSAASLSSEPFGKMSSDDKDNEEGISLFYCLPFIKDSFSLSFATEEDVKNPLADGVVAAYEEHEDSVYSAAWSSADSWTFASLSYGGRLLIHRVPRSLKHSILF